MKVNLIQGRTILSARHGDFTVDTSNDIIFSVNINQNGTIVLSSSNFMGKYYLEPDEFRQALREGSIRIVGK